MQECHRLAAPSVRGSRQAVSKPLKKWIALFYLYVAQPFACSMRQKNQREDMPMSDNPAVQITPPLVAQIVSEYVKRNQVPLADISTVINTVFQSLTALGKAPEPPPQDPAVPIRQSVRPTYVVCLECGMRGKMLRRHIRHAHGMEANEYRTKWRLSPDHPIIAPGYSQVRSDFAKQIGLGRSATPRRRRPSSR